MKNRIVALILTVVMSLLALTSCGSFDFATENLDDYATFDYATFKAALKTLEIEDGDFTTDAKTREEKVAAKIYNAVADKIIASTKEADRVVEGNLGKGDVLYFTYYAVDEKTGNVFFTEHMKESAITASSTKAEHVIKLGDVDKENKLLNAIKDNLADVDVKDYIYSMLTASDLTGDDLKVKAGDTIVISYSRSYTKTDAEGVTTEVKESAAYETITLNAEDAFHAFFLDADSVAKVGGTLEVLDKKDEAGKVTTKKTFDYEVEGVKYTYSNVKILWKVENAGKAIASFKLTPYDSEKKVSVDNLTVTADAKKDLKNVELTYYVFPVYAIHTPAADEVTAADILTYVYGSALKSTSFEAFEEDYKNGEEKIADLLADVADIYDTKKTDNEFYKEGELKTLLDAYNKAVEDGGSKPTDDQKKAIDTAKEALDKAQLAALKTVVEKIVKATKGADVLGDVVFEEYEHNIFHSLKEAYDKDITEKVQAAVWKLINDSVKLTGKYPEKLLKEYKDHLYESYEYEFYKGNASTNVTNYDKYEGNFDAYLIATLKIDNMDKLDATLEKEAKSLLDPIIKIFVVARACEADAVAVLPSFVQADIDGGMYHVNEEHYKDIYGDKAAEKIEEAKKNADESKQTAIDEADMFLVDDAYMKGYKKEIGSAYYRNLVEEYGELNLRASFQFNRLFYYLTSTNIELNEDGDHTEAKYTADGTKIDFRTVSYTIKVETETEEK